MVIIVHFYHRDNIYARKLASRLADFGGFRYSFIIYDSIEKLNKELEKNCDNPGDISLVDYAARKELCYGLDNTLWLTDGWLDLEDRGCLHVTANQSVASISDSIIRAFAITRRGHYDAAVSGENQADIIAMVSLTDSEKATEKGWQLAGRWVSDGKRILWISLVPYPTYHRGMDLGDGASMDDVMLHLLRNENSILALELFRIKDIESGMDVFRPNSRYDDITSIPEKKWISWLSSIKSCGQYDRLIVELGTQVNGLVDAISLSADRCIVLGNGSEAGNMKKEAYTRRMLSLSEGNLKSFVFLDRGEHHDWEEVLKNATG